MNMKLCLVLVLVLVLVSAGGAKKRKKYKVVKENGKVSVVYRPYFKHGNKTKGAQYYRAEYSPIFTDLSKFTHSQLVAMAEGGLYEPCFGLRRNQSIEACKCVKADLAHGWRNISTITLYNTFICTYVPLVVLGLLAFSLRYVLPTLGLMYKQVIMVMRFYELSETKIEAYIRKLIQSNLPGVHQEPNVVVTRWPAKKEEVKNLFELQDIAKDRLVSDQ
ncbi:hypothetical protein Pmani_027896 [Petrolisthes manimaculis]|uniref:Transmembrane protein n=1 Tax=Petrolisthes manimaculis TaxID=1843537 RepID=A0AAE1P3F0_9EUCA|nr:hypothetical protein Pmani_027896 [Petrolisthes manimaculis]